jgi:hypothetical protein
MMKQFAHELLQLPSVSTGSDHSTRTTGFLNDKGEVPFYLDQESLQNRVHFQEESNHYYESRISKEDRQKLWYKQDDYAFFKRQLVRRIKRVMARTPTENDDWISCLEVAFEAICHSSSVEDVMQLLHQSRVPLKNPELLGLEPWTITLLAENKQYARSSLRVLVVAGLITCPERLRKKSRQMSKVSRLFAHLVAVKAAEELLD